MHVSHVVFSGVMCPKVGLLLLKEEVRGDVKEEVREEQRGMLGGR